MGQNESNPASSHSEDSSSKAFSSPNTKPTVKGITVVNPRPEPAGVSSSKKPKELQKLDNLHKFWPILKSTLDYEYPLEPFETGVSHTNILKMCEIYKQYLAVAAQETANEQRSLASRMKDIEMFSAGIVQQLVRRQERIDKILPHLQRVKEVSSHLQETQSLLASCVPLMNRINNMLPEDDRLEQLTIHTSPVHEPSPDSYQEIQPTSSSVQEEPKIHEGVENHDNS